MRVLIAGGRGFLGGMLSRALQRANHEVRILTRERGHSPNEIHWNGTDRGDWIAILRQTDAVVNACGYGLQHWPWTGALKRRLIASRVEPARALTRAMEEVRPRPQSFIQFSGVSRYGLKGNTIADENSAAAEDFLAQLTVQVEAATKPLERLGLRRVVARNAVVLHSSRGLLPLLSLHARLFVGGRFGSGGQPVSWIHIGDHTRAVVRLLEDETARGAYNLIAPTLTTNADFMKAVCRALGRPYWFHVPAWSVRFALGEMSELVLDGRASRPRRLLASGFEFEFPTIGTALRDLFPDRKTASNRPDGMAR